MLMEIADLSKPKGNIYISTSVFIYPDCCIDINNNSKIYHIFK